LTSISQAVSWIATISVANLLTPEDYGLMNMASFLTAYIDFMSDLGIGTAIIQKSDINKKELSSLFWTSGTVGLLLSLVALGLAYPTAHLFKEMRIIPVTSLISIVFIIGSFSSIPSGILRRDFKFKYIGIANMTGALVSCLCQLYFASQGWGVYTLVVGVIILRVTKTAMIFYFSKWWPRLHFSFSEVKPFLKFGIGLMSGAIIYRVYESLDRLIVGRKLGASVLGSYGFSAELANMPLDKIMPVFQQVTFPLLARLQNDVEDRNATFLNNLKYCLYLCAPLFICGATLSHDIILGFLGEKWLSIVFMFRIFCLVKLCEMVRNFTNILFTVTGDTKTPLVFNTLLLVFMPGSIFITVYYLGYQYIMLPWAIVFPIMSFFWIYYTLNRFHISFRHFVNTIIKPVLFGLLFTICCFGVKKILSPLEVILPEARIFLIGYLSIGLFITLLFFPLFERVTILGFLKKLRLKAS
jgi:O-antigen/teichoic acid export membrane protein